MRCSPLWPLEPRRALMVRGWWVASWWRIPATLLVLVLRVVAAVVVPRALLVLVAALGAGVLESVWYD